MEGQRYIIDRVGEETDLANCSVCHAIFCFSCVQDYCTALEKAADGGCVFYKDAEDNAGVSIDLSGMSVLTYWESTLIHWRRWDSWMKKWRMPPDSMMIWRSIELRIIICSCHQAGRKR